MEPWSYIVPFAYLLIIESLTVRWIAGSRIPGLVSRIFATNLAGFALVMFISLTGWWLGWWPDIRNWALRDSFFLLLVIKFPFFWFLFRRWGFQRVFTLHVISNFLSVIILSVIFIYAPMLMLAKPRTADDFNDLARQRLLIVRDAVEEYKISHGYYPEYLWGGDIASWGSQGSPDPLLSEGYLHAYPVNPLNLYRTFFEPRRQSGLKELWFGYKSDIFLHVRNLWFPVVTNDPRFGYRGAKMGNVLPDPNMPETALGNDIRFSVQSKWLPGGFFYRSYDLDENGFPDAYIMGVCGDENYLTGMDCYNAGPGQDRLTTIYNGQRVVSAPDGIRDGVILRLQQGFPAVPINNPEDPIRGITIINDTIVYETGESSDDTESTQDSTSTTEPEVSPTSVAGDEIMPVTEGLH